MDVAKRPCTDELLTRFRLFNEEGGKFRVAIINRCNLDCFFCHNEAMVNPRASPDAPSPRAFLDAQLLDIINAYTRLGGRQVNITGGEPLAHPRFAGFLAGIDKRETRIAVNTNATLANRLLRVPRIDAIDCLLTSLHTTDDTVFRRELGGRSVRKVMEGIAALHEYGYGVEINYSLGPYNRDGFPTVLDFAIEHGIALKVIAFVRSDERGGFYGGQWVDPTWISDRLHAYGAVEGKTWDAFGGQSTLWDVAGTRVKVKNIARGRLETEFCAGCAHRDACGEGIYGLRVGVDGLWKPCLLREERFSAVEQGDYESQILHQIGAMVGSWEQARYRSGAPN